MSLPEPPKWGAPEITRTVRHFHDRIRARVAERVAALDKPWRDVVRQHHHELITAEDLVAFEQEFLSAGNRFEASATVSVREAPEKYAQKEAATASTAEADEQGRIAVGSGDNLVAARENLRGIARFISSLDQVTEMLVDGVPEDTIAVIDDSGGTLTAPILEDFKGVLCLGGTVRSHLGILTREYGIPCFMNCEIDAALSDGDLVEMELTAPSALAKESRRAQVWKLPEGAQ